jgi:hypothetical protein
MVKTIVKTLMMLAATVKGYKGFAGILVIYRPTKCMGKNANPN